MKGEIARRWKFLKGILLLEKTKLGKEEIAEWEKITGK
jgi:hypothetical protein